MEIKKYLYKRVTKLNMNCVNVVVDMCEVYRIHSHVTQKLIRMECACTSCQRAIFCLFVGIHNNNKIIQLF